VQPFLLCCSRAAVVHLFTKSANGDFAGNPSFVRDHNLISDEFFHNSSGHGSSIAGDRFLRKTAANQTRYRAPMAASTLKAWSLLAPPCR
jgi:hypothetical protein